MIEVKALDLKKQIDERLKIWDTDKIIQKMFQKDPSIWTGTNTNESINKDISNRLGWLDALDKIRPILSEIKSFVDQQKKNIKEIILLGMGGSSLAPEVMMDVFGEKNGWPDLTVLDTTNPETILNLMPMIDPDKTLFIVSSKSGGTIETLSLSDYFYSYLQAIGLEAGNHFIAITDPGSGLERIAGKHEKGFLKTFSSPPDVGGRYSALTVFGIVPAALIGIDIEKLIEKAREWMALCGPKTEITENPAAMLGVFMGEAALNGKDKLTLLISPSISRLGAWIEQLVAESLGKDGKGILPLIDEMPLQFEELNDDRAYVYIKVQDEDDDNLDTFYEKVSEKNLPAMKLTVNDKYDLGGLFFIWEFATALAASILEVNPFDQPNVESAKVAARALMEDYKITGRLNSGRAFFSESDIEFFSDEDFKEKNVESFLVSFLNEIPEKDYIAIMAYLPYDEEINDILEEIRAVLRKKMHSAVTLGYGPRFLHSTGQLHKGDGNKGLFIQITHKITEDIQIPGETYSFGTLITAQALGDYSALRNAGRRVCRLHLKGDINENLESILKAL